MIEPVDILGLGAGGLSSLSSASRDRLAWSTFLAGGRRHLDLVEPGQVESFVIGDNLPELVARLRRRSRLERCVVLASGDPLFYGVGHRLGLDLGFEQIRVEPHVSSMQLAFARAGLAWHDATIASIHGRPLASTLLPLLGLSKVGLFTQDGQSPAAIASFFLERGLDNYRAWVCERLGTPEERVVSRPLTDLPGMIFDGLNFVVLSRDRSNPRIPAWLNPGGFVVPDDQFAQPDLGPILLTHADVRAITITRFQGLKAGPIWDIGAGLGGVAVDLARAFSGFEVVAFERSAVQRDYLRENRNRFQVYNLRVVEGEAPDCLVSEARPAAIFLGGSGGRLDAILDLAFERLLEGGICVANFVALENFSRFSSRVRELGWPLDITQVQVSHGRSLAGLTSLVPLRPVWVARTIR